VDTLNLQIQGFALGASSDVCHFLLRVFGFKKPKRSYTFIGKGKKRVFEPNHAHSEEPARKVIHVDMDAFYASVEMRDRPELRGRPLIVGGSPESRAVVCSASYEARARGVRSAMPCSRAARLCPDAVFVRPNFEKYTAASRDIRAIFRQVTDQIEPLSLDEAYLDVTRHHWAVDPSETRASRLAQWICAEIRARLGLSASAGVAPNKLVAKIASDFRKPGGLTVVAPERVEQFMAPLPVGRLWGVGEKTEKRLHELGYFSVTDLRRSSAERLAMELGNFGPELYRQAWGIDHRPVISHWEARSRGSERTFLRDIQDVGRLLEVIDQLCSELASEGEAPNQSEDRARSAGPAPRLGLLEKAARTVTVKIRYEDFTTLTRSLTLQGSTRDLDEIAAIARELLFKNTEVGIRPVRLLGVSVSGFAESGPDSEGPEQELGRQLWLPTVHRDWGQFKGNSPSGS
jgi:DNA polymerase-4